MFSWLRGKTSLPPFSAANPGKGTTLRSAFSNGQRTRSEEADLVAILANVLEKQEVSFKRTKEALTFDDGLAVRPQFEHLQLNEDGTMQTRSTIEINHPSLCPTGTFDFQYGTGATLEESFHKGFEGWVQTDLPVLMDALREPMVTCATLTMSATPGEPVAKTKRQVILGPALRYITRPEVEADDPHPFCSCCLFTNSADAFHEQVQADGFFGIRLYAWRDAAGATEADCRINGVDHRPGIDALAKYATTWPDRGIEYRKQYIIIRTIREPGQA